MENKEKRELKTKLVLKKQALRNLTDLQLQAIAGGRNTASAPMGTPA